MGNDDSALFVVRNKAELELAFQAWAEQHGYIWFEGDISLARSLCSYLGIKDFSVDGVVV